ncbi:hypothetical protein ElyMa_005219000 [Elysia marginata]|uniref:Uncharacterized protein n=1 Tax=Elysia marginata TaxID=1093978 RepID=A0AAV4K072_9GAST|nr:hypothetical protein ElyMa_005219000 [Elysia marginata]
MEADNYKLDVNLLIPWGTQGCDNTPSAKTALAGPPKFRPCSVSGCHLIIYASTPGLFWSAHFSSFLWITVQSLPDDVGNRLSEIHYNEEDSRRSNKGLHQRPIIDDLAIGTFIEMLDAGDELWRTTIVVHQSQVTFLSTLSKLFWKSTKSV